MPSVLPTGNSQNDQVVANQQIAVDQASNVVGKQIVNDPVQTDAQVDQPNANNAFFDQNQRGVAQNDQQVIVLGGQVGRITGGQEPVQQQAQPSVANSKVVATSPVSSIPVQTVFDSHSPDQYVMAGSYIVDQGVVLPQLQMDVILASLAIDEQAANDKIVHQEIGINPDGSFRNIWSSNNGINVQETVVKRVDDTDVAVQQGMVSYIDNKGNPFQLEYVVNETGFHVTDPHIPTSPPMPKAIVRALQFILDQPSTEAPVETTTIQDESSSEQPEQAVTDETTTIQS
ncbi:uncharacterized protein LOC131671615 [Phymastichus coffea]|uniref:uncharacterized protein LOC131671615 n=1 Tax=Phymastichus coffea TaxID=108790 RepID=UPI00273BE98D|nr:uncharacterized protein LOC131671615 [Phymastichus coffea]